MPHDNDVLAQANLISSVKCCTIQISGCGIFILLFSPMWTVPERFMEG